MDKIKVGIISFEHMHALSYTNSLMMMENVEVVGIADDNEFRGTEMASRFNTKYYRDYKDLLKTDVQGVVICTSNKYHAVTAVDAANAGKHILVEKPFATNYEDAKLMLEAAKRNNVKLMTAFPMRFSQGIISAKEAVDRGDIGEILCITGINHGKIPSGWFLNKELSGGGAIMDHTVHIADLMRWFTNSSYTSAYCEGGELIHNQGIDDCGIVTVEFENGVFGTIDCSWGHHKNYTIWPEVYMEIMGTKGVIEVEAFKQTIRVFDSSNNVIEDVEWGSDGDAGLVREFVRAIETGDDPKVTGLDGARAMEVAIAAYKSRESHRKEAIEHI
ncbi:Gfo/Idh/MocA family protein [Clostridium polynesiense]|uniref:Gfo/Idh/MocA family protein n=1 Tax=Clostridium polynesiense TaxID=1325933 RepID=UPI0006940A49|nr:Gfo/Idh/MocA family oxidoreductase [Clostridium polynesiense]